MHAWTIEKTAVKDYINNNGNVPELGGELSMVNSKEVAFIECPLHTLENTHLTDDFCLENGNSMDHVFSAACS